MDYHFKGSDLACSVYENADITGTLMRISTEVPLGVTIVTVYAYFATYRAQPDVAKILRDIALFVNAVSLLYAIVLVSIGLGTRHTMNWFHARFLLDPPSFAADSILFTALAVPGYFTRHWFILPGVFIHFGLMIGLLVEWTRLYKVALIEKPGCYDERYLKDVWIYSSVDFALYVVICFMLAFFNRDIPPENDNANNNVNDDLDDDVDNDVDDDHNDDGNEGNDNNDNVNNPNVLRRWTTMIVRRRWPRWVWTLLTVLALIAFTVVAVVEICFSFVDYNLLHPFLISPAPIATFGQVVPLVTVCAAAALAYIIHFDIHGKFAPSHEL
ncbi:hypothetical protein LTR56_018284 [Elasticomyces elasticus]|nr:hypothetical protein LTR56_018284 [Elasticomyces elasticus]KAK3636774.1 hypothetical protein LTR22_018589 [Elasticomyces elasticus]KAK4912362.1 hypothetical protein LTR49_019180 [Elasticomyces elasticus]KAK5751843.1 hypothetical protein LTS12_018084 [Elasticomyces elasticus]